MLGIFGKVAKGCLFSKFPQSRSFLYEPKIRSPTKVDKGPSLAIKSYLKFCSVTDTPQWQPDRHNTEARFELVDAIRDTTFGSDTGGLELSCCSFSTISQFLERILMEHIDIKTSPDSKLQIDSICSVRILSRN